MNLNRRTAVFAALLAVMIGAMIAGTVIALSSDGDGSRPDRNRQGSVRGEGVVRATPTGAATPEEPDTPIVPRRSRVMFCEPLTIEGGIATLLEADRVVYEPGSCQPSIDATGAIAIRLEDGSVQFVQPRAEPPPFHASESIVWTPATGVLDGATVIMTEEYLAPDAEIFFDSFDNPILVFRMTDDGEIVFGSLTERISGRPLATFVDGTILRGREGSVIAPTVQGRIEDVGQTTGLSLEDARNVAAIMNSDD